MANAQIPYTDPGSPDRYLDAEEVTVDATAVNRERVIICPGQIVDSAPTRGASTALEASNVIKASAGMLYSVMGFNSGAEQYIQVHNASSLPADTAVPIYVFQVPASSSFTLDLAPYGDYFSTGIVVCNSSTLATKTIGSADCWFIAQYT